MRGTDEESGCLTSKRETADRGMSLIREMGEIRIDNDAARGVLVRRSPVTTETYDNHGLRFEYPSSWELEVSEDGPVMTVAVQDPGGLGFTLITTDESRPDPAYVADEAL